MKGYSILNEVDTSALETLLLKDGLMQAVDHSTINQFTQNEISVFCVKNGIYQIVTTELVEFVRNEIGDSKAIEIGAGNGCLGRSLGITLTDSYQQAWPKIRAMYNNISQEPITYPRDIKNYNALSAISMFRPKTVVGAWVTELFKRNKVTLDGNGGIKDLPSGNMYGVDEARFKGKIDKYILIGNENIHCDKEILRMFPYKTYKFDWLISRSMSREKNIIYVFDCK